MLTGAYATYGVEADITLLIQYTCADDGTLSTLYQGRFSFDQYKEVRGSSGCYVECGVQNGYGMQLFRSRMNQKVSLDSTATFDPGYPALPPYPGLGTLAAMQPMTIRMVDYATIDTDPIGSQLYGLEWRYLDADTQLYENRHYPAFAAPPSTFGGQDGGTSNPQNNEFDLGKDFHTNVIIPYTHTRSQELGDFPGGLGDIYADHTYDTLDMANSIFTFTPDIPYEDYNINIDIELTIGVFNGRDGNIQTDLRNLQIDVLLCKGLNWPEARSNLHLDYNLHANDGSTNDNQNHNRYYPTRGCKIDQKGITVADLNSDLLHSDIGSQILQYSFHTGTVTGDKKGIIMQPGDQLFLLVQVKNPLADPNYYNQISQIVFFSDTYTYRNSYYTTRAATGPFSVSKKVDVSQGYTLIDGTSSGTNIYTGGKAQALSYIRVSYDSHYRKTPAPVYMVGEALSRSAEIITNGQYQVYSDYFGRQPASTIPTLPQPPATTGPGALTSITNGLLIRGYSPLQVYYMGIGQNSLASISTASYTLDPTQILGSSGVIISMKNSAGGIVTIPPGPIPYFPIGTEFIVEQGADNIVTIQAGSGVTLISPGGSYGTSGLGSQILITCIATDTWLIASRASMFCSFQDIIESMKSIHAVGFGLEPDPTRPGMKRIRVEPISYFYDHTTTMLTCENVDMITTSVNAGECISEFDIGYGKWEAEQAQGLDEFLTKRTYRTGLSLLRSKRSEVCKMVASGYAIEATRRRLGTTTTDWRYDKDIFVICLDDVNGPYEVNCNLGLFTNLEPQYLPFSSEQGGLEYCSRIIDPTTIYNARISPARNALRWLPYIFQCFPNPSTGSLIFTEGDGNYYAAGQLYSGALETAPLSENQTLKLSDILGDPSPVWRNEIVTFKYPLGYNEWINIYNAKTGLIKFNVNDGAWIYGYIQELKYNLFEGIGEFTLKVASS